jgi:sigma-B regulation protein RsbU (phosphoserine phosphatase)
MDKNIFTQDSFSAAALDELPSMVRVLDKNAEVLYANKAFLQRFGENREPLCKSIPGASDDCAVCAAHECISKNENATATQNVRGRMYEINAKPIMFEEQTYALEIITDISTEYNLKDKLISANARMLHGLEVARSLQLSILRNTLPIVDGYSFSAQFLPCEALGGDMYDAFVMRDGRIFMYIADVSGHGVMPAMLTVYLRQEMFAQCKKPGISPTQVLSNIQTSFEDLSVDENIYITIFALVLDPLTGQFVCSNAGHSVTPLIAGPQGVRELFLPGSPICRWRTNEDREQKYGKLEVGERMLLYTDGLDDIHVDMFVMHSLHELLLNTSLRGSGLLSAIKEKFAQKKEDDVTMLLCERK